MASSTRLAATAASNSFRVRDPDRLRALLEPYPVSTHRHGRRVRLSFHAGIPWLTEDPASGERVTLDLPDLIAGELEPDEVVVLKEIRDTPDGPTGTALAFNAHGATVTVDLEEISSHAAELTATPTNDQAGPAARHHPKENRPDGR